MEKKVQQKIGSPSHESPPGVLLDPAVLAAFSEKPLWAALDHAMLVATSTAIRKVMKDNGFRLTPPQSSQLAQCWEFDRDVADRILKPYRSPAVIDN